MPGLLILRPEPGATATARLAAERGMTTIVAPLFVVTPVAWEPPPPEAHDAIMLTSANAARHGGAGLVRLAELPVYAVGAATAAAARAAGLDVTHVGAGNADDLVGAMAAAGVRLPLHLAGADHKAVTRYGMTITRRIVYRSAAVTALPEAARSALADGRVALIHSPRAAAMLAALVTSGRDAIRSAAISPAAAAALGPGWGAVTIAAQPDDDALLAAAALLCEGLADRSGAPA